MDRYQEIINYYYRKLAALEKIDDLQIKKLVVLSMIDSLAQEYYNYPKNSTKAFCDFIIRFTKSYKFLNEIDPVTLFYENKQFFTQKGYSLDYLDDGSNLHVPQVIIMPKTKEIINCARSNNLNIDKHSYANLIYKFRSKLSHEFKDIGSPFKMLEENKIINYISYGEINIEWKINIPYSFLKLLFNECLDGFIKERKLQNIDPFENSKEYLNWYE